MAEVIGVRFKEVGKIYYFDPTELTFKQGDRVIVETARGIECGTVALANKDVDDESIVHPLKPVLRQATENDLEHLEENKKREANALKICEEKIREHNLEMKLVDVEYTFDNSKILFYFTADGRVDFRQLVKDLANVFRTRIELRQIGVRDEAKMLGGLGICGKPFCCNSFLGEFQPVSIKMAKEQGLSLSPVKISGTCGRLMCCLKYEQDAYTDLLKHTPRVGNVVKTPEGKGTVVEVSLLTGKLKVKMANAPEEAAPQVFDVKQTLPYYEKKGGNNEYYHNTEETDSISEEEYNNLSSILDDGDTIDEVYSENTAPDKIEGNNKLNNRNNRNNRNKKNYRNNKNNGNYNKNSKGNGSNNKDADNNNNNYKNNHHSHRNNYRNNRNNRPKRDKSSDTE